MGDGVIDGQVVTLEYTVRRGDGTLLDSTGACGPVAIMYGSGQLFPALEDRIATMAPGETRTFRIPPEEAFGEHRAGLVQTVPRDRLPADPDLSGIGFIEAVEDRHERGLARAVFADDPVDRPALDYKVHVPVRVDLAEALVDGNEFDGRGQEAFSQRHPGAARPGIVQKG